jgi:RNA polymerase sigma-70 factor (ECF subfamily)
MNVRTPMNVFTLLKAPEETALPPEPSVEDVYRSHADFVWTALQRFGIRAEDLDDVLQEVFVVVYKRLPSFRGDAQMTTWLYGISLRVASVHRRRSHVRRERDMLELEDIHSVDSTNPEDGLAERQRRSVLEALLDELDVEKRALLVMFEIDELPCEEIAAILGIPVGTVYSRLHAARRAFAKAVDRFRSRAKGRQR